MNRNQLVAAAVAAVVLALVIVALRPSSEAPGDASPPRGDRTADVPRAEGLRAEDLRTPRKPKMRLPSAGPSGFEIPKPEPGKPEETIGFEQLQHDTDVGSVWPADASGIRSALEERLGDLHDCYETALAIDADVSGDVSVRFDVVPDGGPVTHASNVTLPASELKDTMLEGCLATVFEELRFESPPDNITVNWPLTLMSAEDEEPE